MIRLRQARAWPRNRRSTLANAFVQAIRTLTGQQRNPNDCRRGRGCGVGASDGAERKVLIVPRGIVRGQIIQATIVVVEIASRIGGIVAVWRRLMFPVP